VASVMTALVEGITVAISFSNGTNQSSVTSI